MAILKILQYPDERLHKHAAKVTAVTAQTRHFIKDLAETMYAAPGIGLAATQVDVHQRIIVVDTSENNKNLMVFINPEIVSMEGESGLKRAACLYPAYTTKLREQNALKSQPKTKRANTSH